MENEIRILMLEDSTEDVSLIQWELKRGGVKSTYVVVNEADEFQTALDEFRPDIILSDHSMPTFNSIEALEMVKTAARERKTVIPFILVTGTVSEEFAAQCIRSGADDYVLKDRMKRLPEAVRSALEKARIANERKTYFETVVANDARMKEAQQLANFGTWKAYLKTGITEWSDGSFRLRGYEPGEIVPTNEIYFQHIHPDDRERVKREVEEVVHSGLTHESEYRIITRDGKVRYMYSRIAVQSSERDDTVLVGFSIDITDRRHAENLLHEAYEIARIGGWEYDVIKKEFTLSDVARELFEAGTDFVADPDNIILLCKDASAKDAIRQAVQQGMQHGTPWDIEFQIETIKGNLRWVRSMGKAELNDGICVRLYGSFQDIHERKQAQIELEDQNTKLKKIAWTQSHVVRAPLARLMGLVQLMQRHKDQIDNIDALFDNVMTSAEELDAILRHVVRLTEDVPGLNKEL